MKAEKIIVEPFSELAVVSYKGVKQINDHGEVKIEGNIPFAMLEEYCNLAKKEKNGKNNSRRNGWRTAYVVVWMPY